MPYPISDAGTGIFIDNHFYITPGFTTGEYSDWASHGGLIDVSLSGASVAETADVLSSPPSSRRSVRGPGARGSDIQIQVQSRAGTECALFQENASGICPSFASPEITNGSVRPGSSVL